MTSGVYKIVHIESQRPYVGSSIDVCARWKCHRVELNGGRHCNVHLQAAWDKHGPEAFRFEVMEECAPEQVLLREQHYLDTLRPFGRHGFNICLKAGNTAGTRHRQETKQKMRKSALGRTFSPETRTKMAAAKRGRKLSTEHKAKISKSLLGNQHTLGFRHTQATKDKMREIGRRRVFTPEHRANISAAKQAASRQRKEA